MAARANAPAAALAWYEQALTLWPAVVDASAVAGIDETTLVEHASDTASAAGNNDRAVAIGRRALTLVDPRLEPVRAALRWERLGRFCWLAGDQVGSQRAYEEALRVVPAEPSAARARVLAGMAQSLMLRSRHLESRAVAEEAVAVATSVGAGAEEGHARNTLGTDLQKVGHSEEGIAQLEAAGALARDSRDGAELARYYINLCEALVDVRRAGEALRLGIEGVRVTTDLGLVRVHAPAILGNIMDALYLIGEWDEIDSRSADALAQHAEPWSAVTLLLARARLAIGRGGQATMAAEVAALDAVPPLAADIQYGVVAAALRAQVAAAAGEWTTAHALVRAALVKTGPRDDVRRHLELVAIGVQLEADELDDARLSGRRLDAGESRARAYELLADAVNIVTRIAKAGGRRSAPFELLLNLAEAHLSRIPGPADPTLWAGIATKQPRA